MKISVEQVLIYNNYIQYKNLSEMTQESFNGSNATELNVFIDMYSMMKDIYSGNIVIEDYSIITSCICNLCAHIRKFYQKIGVGTTIYIIHSKNNSMNNNGFVAEYNSKFIINQQVNAMITDIVNSNIGLLNMIAPYLDNVYFREGTVEPSVMILDMIYKNEAMGNLNPNIVFSRDVISFQIAAVHPNTSVFMKSGAEFYSVNMSNVIRKFIKKTRKEVGELDGYVDICKYPQLLGLIIALTNLPNRSIKSIYNIKVASKIILEAINNRTLLLQTNVPSTVYDALSTTAKFNIDRVLFQSRYMALDIQYQQKLYMETAESKDASWMINLYDPNSMKEINSTYFKNNPINLELI